MSHTARLPLFSLAPHSLQAMIKLSESVSRNSLSRQLVELLNLRVSHVNGCGLCADMHWRFLIAQGADPRHLNALGGWREAPFFSAEERVALAWADAVNALPQRDDTEPAYHELRAHFSETQIAELTYGIVAIRGWNILNLSFRTQVPEQPAPGM